MGKGDISVDYRLAKGVDLHVIPTKQFKMTHILIDFATPQTTTNATARNLLANLLETSTHLYPTQTALARQMAKLYGAFVSLGVGRVGRYTPFGCDQVLLITTWHRIIYLRR